MALKPWYNVVFPREDLREGRPLDASEFAVHLDQVRDRRGPDVYWQPRQFFERTFLTESLTSLAAQVVRRLSGRRTETSAVFNLVTQFGGGKTHALTLLYHLAQGGPHADAWPGVAQILDRAGVASVPAGRVAVFAGTEFDSLTGRGGDDGTPLRKTPWGEIAFQLGGAEAFSVVAEHDARFIEPKGDVIRASLPEDRPCLILMDEIMTYVSTYRRLGYHNSLYNFIHSLSEVAKGESNVVLVVSLPKSEFEYTAEDEADQRRFEKMLDRNGKSVMMSAETETSEIIRRRLFEWDLRAVGQAGRVLLPKEALQTCTEYATWVADHRAHLPGWFPVDRAFDEFSATYPFHPTVLSVFERKWRVLPQFQQTRGILRLLALWVSLAYNAGFKGAHRDPLVGLGTAPLDDPTFRTAVLEQLGENRLEGVITTDIMGKAGSHALRLDSEAEETIRRARVHRKVATAIFFESNGGAVRAEATLPELRLAVADPGLDVGNVETALDALTATGYYLRAEGTRYRFDLKPNLNKVFSDRRASIPPARVRERMLAETQKVFQAGTGVERVYFPEKSGDIPNQPALTLAVIAPEHSLATRDATLDRLDKLVREAGASSRTYKSAVIFAVPERETALADAARNALAWEAIEDEMDLQQFDASDQRHLGDKLRSARAEVREAVWRVYNTLFLLGKDNQLRPIELGLVHSSAAESLVGLILHRLEKDGELVKEVGVSFLLRNWPPAFKEWPTRKVHDDFFASPQFPRLLNGASLKETIAKGVSNGFLAYVGKDPSGDYQPFVFGTEARPGDIELTPDMYIITKETAEAYQKAKAAPTPAPAAPTPLPVGIDGPAHATAPSPAPVSPASTTTVAASPARPTPAGPSPLPSSHGVSWTGTVPPQKWMKFYTGVMARLVNAGNLRATVTLTLETPTAISSARVDEIRAALRELGLDEGVQVE